MQSAPPVPGKVGLPSSLMMRPSRFFASTPHPEGHSRHEVAKYVATPGMISSGVVTRERSSPAGRLQPLAAATAPEVAMTLKNDLRSIWPPGPLIDSSRSKGPQAKVEGWLRSARPHVSGPKPCEPYHVPFKTVKRQPREKRLGASAPSSAERVESLPTGARGLVEITVAVRERDERGFELRRSEKDAALEHAVKEARVAGGVGPLCRCVVGHRA